MKYWIGVASRGHVWLAAQGGFAQVCHGKAKPLWAMDEGDWIIYYSPKIRFEEKEPCQKFTAIGKVKKGDPYPFSMSENFIPYRRDIEFFPCNEVSIKPLITDLSFIKDKEKWGFPFRRGCFSIEKCDFQLIASQMI